MTGKVEIVPENQHVQKKKRFPKLNFSRNEILILLSFFFLAISASMFSPYAPVWLKQIFEVDTYFIIGFAGAIPNFVIAFGTWFWGIFADKYGKKPFVLLGIGASGLMYVALMFVQTPVAFLIGILIGNIFVSAQTSNFYAFATLTSTKKKETILGEIAACFSLAWLISSPIAATMQDKITVSNQPDFLKSILESSTGIISSQLVENPAMAIQLFIAVVACIISVSIIIFTKNDPTHKKSKDPEIISEDKNMKTTSRKFTMNTKILILIVVIGFFQQASSGGFWAFSSLYFVDILGAKWVQYSYFLIVVTSFGVILSLILGRITKSKKVILTVNIMTFIQIFIYLTLALSSNNLALSLIVYSVPMYVVFNVCLYGLIGSYTSPRRRATAFGIYNTIGLLGSVSSTMILGMSADLSPTGIYIMLIIVTGFAVTVFILSLVLTLLYRKAQQIAEIHPKDKIK